jgi:hypothetical protein
MAPALGQTPSGQWASMTYKWLPQEPQNQRSPSLRTGRFPLRRNTA